MCRHKRNRNVLILLILLLFIARPLFEDNIDFTKTQPTVHKHQHNKPYIVFINGLSCQYQGNLAKDMGFPCIRRSLTTAGYNFLDSHFLLYSYTGGTVIEGKWQPNFYLPKNTGQPIEVSVKRLDEMIKQFSVKNPEANFILIGHSLGGRLAIDYVSSNTPLVQEKIKGVVTLNSPLLGAGIKLPKAILPLLSYSQNIYTSPAVQQLLWEVHQGLQIFTYRKQTVTEIQRHGIKVATFSTNQDLVVKASTGCLIDKNGIPLTEGKIISVKPNNFSIREISGHMGILKTQEVCNYINSLCRSLQQQMPEKQL